MAPARSPTATARPRDRFAEAARAAGVRRVVYLGGLVPADAPASPHLASRLEVEQALLAAAPEAVALRASIVVSARSRSFRFLVRLVERVPVMPLPAWRTHRTRPIDGRDVIAFLERAGTSDVVRRPAVARHRRPGHGHLRPARRAHPRRAAARAPAREPPGHHDRRSAAAWPPPSPARTRAWSARSWARSRPTCCPATTAPPSSSACACTRFDAAIERALREWETVEELAGR